jgi:transcriptional regulator with XRE-family HTH domain
MVSERRAFGEQLKRHRERCGITLQSIAQNTKVAASLYAGLERGDCSRWPTGIYSRAYVRAYAEAVGLNPTDTLEEFNATFGPTTTAPHPPGVPVHPQTSLRQLRLSMAEDPAIHSERMLRRAALAAVELVVGCLIASLAHVGLGANLWVTLSCVLGYFVAGRAVSDQPLLYWLFERTRSAAAPEPAAPAEAVPVGDAASTTA